MRCARAGGVRRARRGPGGDSGAGVAAQAAAFRRVVAMDADAAGDAAASVLLREPAPFARSVERLPAARAAGKD